MLDPGIVGTEVVEILLSRAQHVVNRRRDQYLRSIGIGYKVIRKYKIGYCDSSLAHALVKKINAGDETLKNEMSDAGLLEFIAQRGIRERFDGQIIFPLFDPSTGSAQAGNLVQMFGRAVPEKIKIALVQTLVS